MPCACNTKKSKFTVLKPNGSVYRTYGTKAEADAAASRIGGTVK